MKTILEETHATQMKRYDILGAKFSLLPCEDVMTAVMRWKKDGKRNYVTLTPPHSVLMCHRDPQLQEATAEASMTLPDGVGIILAAHLLGYPHHGRVPGPTLMLRLCDWGRTYGIRHFFYGGQPGVAEALIDKLTAKFPGMAIAGSHCPPFRPLTPVEDDEIVRQINDSRPDIVWVGLGSPKQEKWMADHVGRINAATMIGVGAAFDFHSGLVEWAPGWVRRAGLEWAHRLIKDPRRMWRRNVNSFVFLAEVLYQRFRLGTSKECLLDQTPPYRCDVAETEDKAARRVRVAQVVLSDEPSMTVYVVMNAWINKRSLCVRVVEKSSDSEVVNGYEAVPFRK